MGWQPRGLFTSVGWVGGWVVCVCVLSRGVGGGVTATGVLILLCIVRACQQLNTVCMYAYVWYVCMYVCMYVSCVVVQARGSRLYKY